MRRRRQALDTIARIVADLAAIRRLRGDEYAAPGWKTPKLYPPPWPDTTRHDQRVDRIMIESFATGLAGNLKAALGLDTRTAHLYRGHDGWCVCGGHR
jgi:hypothetical protein